MNAQGNQARAIFLEVIEQKSAAGRVAVLDRLCGGNPDLRAHVEQLLHSHELLGTFHDAPGSVAAADIIATADSWPNTEQPGAMIGPYKLLELLAEGGMGSVFVAEQEHPIRRKVAIKVIKPGMDSRQVLGRFESERQVLALMDHPNIARVLDAGTTNSGRPYFVMELVRGVPITEFCDQRRLAPQQRLELFVQVCRAIQHAHQKGVIHRDIKPSNILVTLHDDLAVPKVIDFGIAKATGLQLTEDIVYTAFHQFIGTPLYMSPEQAEMNALDVDTRSDIYSLGVLLYELFTGSTPFAEDAFREVGFDEMRRQIREVDPPRPSQRLSTLATEALSTVSMSRGVDERRLNRELRGDLDCIVMKALEKDRNRRYESAAALADDIERHLNNEPVTAGPPTQLYRAGKFVRRNRGPVVAACLVAVAILGGVIASTRQAIRATRAERQAVANAALARESAEAERRAKEAESVQRKQAETISSFLINAFNSEQPEHDIQALAQILKQSSQDLQSAYPDDPAARALFLATIGRAHYGLRRFDEAESLYRQCLELASDPGLIDRVRHELATCLIREGKSDDATPMLYGFFVDRLKRSAAPQAHELLAILPTVPDVAATVDGTPGMDGLEMDGDNDYVVLPRMFFDARPPWTLEVIVWPVEIDPSSPETGSPSSWTSLISATDAGSIGLESIRRRWAIELYAAGIAGAEWVDNYASATARVDVPLQRWQHVAGVWDGKELRLYFDGQLQDTRHGVSYCTQLSNSPMFLGADPANLAFVEQVAEGFFHGRLRGARISHAAEYTDSFSPPERLEKTPGSIGLYDFTIDTGRFAIDRSGHGNHGIIIGAKYAKDPGN